VITIEECRELLGRTCTLTDSQIEALREQLYQIAELAMEAPPPESQINDRGGDLE
jgi:hypothetical protein